MRFNHNQFWIFPDFIQAVWDYGANESIWYLIFLQTLENQVCHLICRYMYLMLFVGLIEMKNHWASSKLATHKERRYKKWYKIKLAIKIRSWKKLSFWANHYVNFLRISILFFCKSLSIEYIFIFDLIQIVVPSMNEVFIIRLR